MNYDIALSSGARDGLVKSSDTYTLSWLRQRSLSHSVWSDVCSAHHCESCTNLRTTALHPYVTSLHFYVSTLQFYVINMQSAARSLQEMLKATVFSIERCRNSRVTHQQLADEIGVAKRTLDEWMRGAYAPTSVEAVLTLICLVPDDSERARLLTMWADSRRNQNTVQTGRIAKATKRAVGSRSPTKPRPVRQLEK